MALNTFTIYTRNLKTNFLLVARVLEVKINHLTVV